MTHCIICERKLITSFNDLQKLNLVNKICVCDRPLTNRMIKRLEYWMCRRKKKYTKETAQRKCLKYIFEKNLPGVHVYPCPFCFGWHVGKINDVLKEQYKDAA